MEWTVSLSKKAAKQVDGLPAAVKIILKALLIDIRKRGPVQGEWRNYSKLTEVTHHCHLKKGHPTFVAVWQVTNRTIRIVEVTYVGTHENAPY